MKKALSTVIALVWATSALGMGKPMPDLPRFDEVVSAKIYRGAQPSEAGFQILASDFKIRTVLDLRNEDQKQIDWEHQVVKSLGMDFISVPTSSILSPNDWDMEYIEDVLENPKHYPIFVHCQHGRDRTGLVIGLYRVLHEKMAPSHAYQEMLDHGFRAILYGLNHYFEQITGYGGY